MQEAGANQALELAFTLADGKEYVKTALAKGLDVDDFAGRLSFFWAIGMNFYLEIAKMRAARLLWCRIMKGFDAEEPQEPDAAHALPDLGLEPDRAGPVQQRRAHDHRGDGRGVRRHAEPAHQRVRRGDRAADRVQRAHRAQHAAHHPGRDAHHQRGRPLGRQLHDGEADPGDGGCGVEDHRGSRRHGRHDRGRRAGWAKLKIEAGAAEKQARIDSGRDVIVGVNKYRLRQRRRDRHPARSTTAGARTASRAAAGDPRQARRRGGAGSARRATAAAASGEGNLLELAIEAVRLRATVGEVSDALEKVYGRHRADTQKVTGVYAAAYDWAEGWEKLQVEIAASPKPGPAPARDDRQARPGPAYT